MNSHIVNNDELKQYIEYPWSWALIVSSAVYLENSIKIICIF